VLAVAVLLDATLIRLVLLPVALRLLGARAWWIPRWLDRMLPQVNLGHGRIHDAQALEGRSA
jgi:RND superfamily putative drug exporter